MEEIITKFFYKKCIQSIHEYPGARTWNPRTPESWKQVVSRIQWIFFWNPRNGTKINSEHKFLCYGQNFSLKALYTYQRANQSARYTHSIL